MRRIFSFTLLALACSLARADAQNDCAAGGGVQRSGTVVQGPRFTHGQFRKGVELSHTHLKVRSDQDGRVYDVAIDNVFASDFDADRASVPPSLAAIRVNDRVDLCGALYERGVGIHFVHTNCGARPSAEQPDGWLRVVGANGRPGANLEAGTAMCTLFTHGGRRARR